MATRGQLPVPPESRSSISSSASSYFHRPLPFSDSLANLWALWRCHYTLSIQHVCCVPDTCEPAS